jgi:plasmid stabilization system protein ParE
MAFKIRWSPRAISNLEEIRDHISKDSRYYAFLFIIKIIDIIESIPQFPESGRVVPEYQNQYLREKIYKSYRIVYRIKGDCIEIAAISHGAKLLPDIL